MNPPGRRPRDLRAYASSTQGRLLLGAAILLFGLGIALVAAIYGAPAAGGALLCFLAGLIPIGLIFLSLRAMEWIVRRGRNGSNPP